MKLWHLKDVVQQKRILFIGNPKSGRAWPKWKIKSLLRALRNDGFSVEAYFESNALKLISIARNVKNNPGAIIIGGGDGTIKCIINALNDPSRIPILPIPWGTSNSIANELGISGGLSSALRLIKHLRIIKADMGIINNKRFLLCAGFGFDGALLHEKGKKGHKGYRGYILPFIKALLKYREKPIKVSIGNKSYDCATLVVGNCSRYGWRFRITPHARLNSGMLDVCMLKRSGRLSLLYYAILCFLGVPQRIKGIRYLRAQELYVDSNYRIPIQVDGDYFGTTPANIRLVPGHIPLLRPP